MPISWLFTTSWLTSTSFVTAPAVACPPGSGPWTRTPPWRASWRMGASLRSSPTGRRQRCESGRGDLDVGLAAEKAEVRRPAQDERRRRVGGVEANVDGAERRASGELVAG